MKTCNFNFPVIGFMGKQGAGKSEAAKILEAYGYKRSSFAGPLKDMCRAIGIPETNLTGKTEDKLAKIDILQNRDPIVVCKTMLNAIGIKTVDMHQRQIELFNNTCTDVIKLMLDIKIFDAPNSRVFQQLLGTEWGRQISYDFWVNIWNLSYERNKRFKYVVDDVRFDNELNLIRSKKGFVVKIISEDTHSNQGIFNHASEQSDFIKADATLFNGKVDKRRYEHMLIELLEYMA